MKLKSVAGILMFSMVAAYIPTSESASISSRVRALEGQVKKQQKMIYQNAKLFEKEKQTIDERLDKVDALIRKVEESKELHAQTEDRRIKRGYARPPYSFP